MSDMLRPADIAVIIQNKLNTIAVSLYDAEVIVDKVVFNVTADYQLYERLQKGEYEVDDYEDFTPVIISRVDVYQYPEDYLRYFETYNITVYGYSDQLASLETIFKYYSVQENTTLQSEVIDTFRVSKEMNDVSFGVDINSKDARDEKRIIGEGSFTWEFLDGVMTTFDIILQIDGETMPYLEYRFVDSNRTIQTQTINTNGQTGSIRAASFYGISLTLPYISTSTVIKNLYKEFYEGVYNKKHVFSYYDSALDETFTYDVVIQQKEFYDVRPKVSDFTINFVRVEPTVTLTIDDVIVPVLSYSMHGTQNIDSTQNINEDSIKSVGTGYSYQIDLILDISDTSNTKVMELLNDVISLNFSKNYTIRFIYNTIDVSYDVIFAKNDYVFDLNPLDNITLSFVKVDNDI